MCSYLLKILNPLSYILNFMNIPNVRLLIQDIIMVLLYFSSLYIYYFFLPVLKSAKSSSEKDQVLVLFRTYLQFTQIHRDRVSCRTQTQVSLVDPIERVLRTRCRVHLFWALGVATVQYGIKECLLRRFAG